MEPPLRIGFVGTYPPRRCGIVLIGDAGWHPRGGPRPEADKQPTDAVAFVQDLVLPYGLSDAAVGIALVSLPKLLTALRAGH